MYQYLLNVYSYMLHGYKYKENFWFLTGKGRNGKSLYSSLMDVTLGQYSYCPTADIFTSVNPQSSSHSDELAKMKGKRCVMASEPDDTNTQFNVSRLKKWRGNDKLQARPIYESSIEFKPQFAFMILMNDMPSLDKVDSALAMTMKVIHFPFTFVDTPDLNKPNERQGQNGLKETFDTDIRYRQQFIRLLLENYAENIKGRKMFDDPEEVKAATKEYLADNNIVGVWLNERIDITNDKADRIKSQEMYEMFSNDTKVKMTYKAFMKAMRYNNINEIKNNVMWFTGVKGKHVDVDDMLD